MRARVFRILAALAVATVLLFTCQAPTSGRCVGGIWYYDAQNRTWYYWESCTVVGSYGWELYTWEGFGTEPASYCDTYPWNCYDAGDTSDPGPESCGDERDTIIQEYANYNVGFRPFCLAFRTSGGSANFSWDELNRAPGNGHRPWGIVHDVLFNGLEGTRSEYNRGRIYISSGYRCPHGNASLPKPGAPNSRHMYGDAADMVPMDQVWSHDEWVLLKDAAIRAGADFIEPWGTGPGETDDHVHADWRWSH